MYAITVSNCPECGCPQEGHFFGMCSQLGPAAVECWKCRGVVDVGRREWIALPILARLWFVLVTGLYVLLLGILTGNFLDQARQLWSGADEIVDLRFEAREFQFTACLGGAAALVLQLVRVLHSRRRSASVSGSVVRSHLFSLDLNLQYKRLVVLIVLCGIARIKSEFGP